MTSDAIRNGAAEKPVEDPTSTANIYFYCMLACGICAGLSFVGFGSAAFVLYRYAESLEGSSTLTFSNVTSLYRASNICTYLAEACTFVSVVATIIFWGLWIDEAKKMYNVDYDAIPRYMVDEKDITGYNSKGEKIVLKNQSAYYKAVTCNRDSSNDQYDKIGNVADLNGTTGKQWLALYYAKNESEEPILADSLKVVLKDSKIPSGYTTGIHSFGTTAAENLNNMMYVWNSSAPKVYVYFKTEEAAGAGAEGSSFTWGYLASAAGAGLLIGAVVTAVCMTAARKKKKDKTEST